MRLKNASLQELIAGGLGRIGPKLYAIAGSPHQPVSSGLYVNVDVHTDFDQLQKAAVAATAHHHPRHTKHAAASGQLLCWDFMLSEVCQWEFAAPEGAGRSRSDQRAC